MTNHIINQSPYLRTTREFPEDLHQLTVEVNKSYLDIASAVNNRTIGIYPSTRSAITGNAYYVTGTAKQPSLRQMYPFQTINTGTSLVIPTQLRNYENIVLLIGTCITDRPDYRPIPYVDATLTDQISIRFDITTTSIIITNGTTAPNILSGLAIIEWLGSI